MERGKRTHVAQGDRYGRFTIVREVESVNYKRRFLCRCDCGNEKIVKLGDMKFGGTISCGCYCRENNRKLISERSTTHGLSHTPLYKVWLGMKSRCYNPNATPYKNYGGRGITVCEEWLEHEPFYKWGMANGYESGLTIERINNDGNYEPGNCKWATYREQANNNRRNTKVQIGDRTESLTTWLRLLGLSSSTIYKRLNKGWSAEKALTVPVRPKASAKK